MNTQHSLLTVLLTLYSDTLTTFDTYHDAIMLFVLVFVGALLYILAKTIETGD